MRAPCVGLAARRARASFPDMSHRAAALILTALLAFPGVVAAQTGTPRGDDLAGTAGADTINGRGGNDRITGRGGDDHLSGGRGNDTIFGDAGRDVIIGGSGNDTLLGGAGNDRISGGPGSDTIAAGLGKDLVRARDGVADHVTCGPGRARVIADPQDDLAADCEVVQRG
jgi:RTX calcium-binding nonapeptide repeat (4 copies)